MNQNNFNRDLRREKIVSDFILTNGAELFKKRDYLISRNSNKDLQLKGIDLLIQNKGKFGDSYFHAVDEKSATSYFEFNDNPNVKSEHSLTTFAFELDYENSDSKRAHGWLFKKDIETEYYLLTWIWVKEELSKVEKATYKIEAADITQTKTLLIPKYKIHGFLKGEGIDIPEENTISEKNFYSVSYELRQGKKNKFLRNNKSTPRLFYSEDLTEKPVNVLISSYHLEKMAIDGFIIRPGFAEVMEKFKGYWGK